MPERDTRVGIMVLCQVVSGVGQKSVSTLEHLAGAVNFIDQLAGSTSRELRDSNHRSWSALAFLLTTDSNFVDAITGNTINIQLRDKSYCTRVCNLSD